MSKLTEHLNGCKLDYEKVAMQESYRLQELWLSRFAKEVKEQTGKWVHNKYKWHTFSFSFHPSTHGIDALEEYSVQRTTRFVIFDESLQECYQCVGNSLPDLTKLYDDHYVSHPDMCWTMAFTHEQPTLGPYFAKFDSYVRQSS